MRTLHLNVENLDSEQDLVFAEAWLRMLAGVCDIAAVPSARLLSVLYDEHKTGPRSILSALESSGFRAAPLKSGL